MQSNQGTQKVTECKHNSGDKWDDGCCGQDAEAKSSSEELLEQLEEQDSDNEKIALEVKMLNVNTSQIQIAQNVVI